MLAEFKAKKVMRELTRGSDEVTALQGFAPVEPEGQGYQATTNLCVNNLGPTVTEEALKTVFSQFGEVHSTKVMWPRSEEEKRHGRNRGFVSYVHREEAEVPAPRGIPTDSREGPT